MFDLVGPDFMPLSVTQMPWDPSIIDSSESASAIVHVKQNLERRALNSHGWFHVMLHMIKIGRSLGKTSAGVVWNEHNGDIKNEKTKTKMTKTAQRIWLHG